MSLATLFGKLQEHEMELMRLHQHEEDDKKRKGIAPHLLLFMRKMTKKTQMKRN